MIPILLAFAAGLSDLVSGLIPFRFRMEESHTRYVIGFASGTMLGAVFFEMLPELRPEDSTYIGLGFFLFYLLERLTMIHSCGEAECTSDSHKVGWIPVLGMASDNIIDGLGIAIAYLINPVIGIIVAVSVIIHEIPQGLSTTVLLQRSGQGVRAILIALAAEAVLYPIGAALAGFLPGSLSTPVLAFVTGDFLYIAASDLLPDAHKRFNLRVIFSVLCGALSVFLLEYLLIA